MSYTWGNASREEEKRKKEEWIASLKVGDEVAVRGSRYTGREWYIYKIVKVTPTGRLNLEKGGVVMPDGSLRGGGFNEVYPVSLEVRTSIKRFTTRQYISNHLKIHELSDVHLMRLLNIVKEHEEDKTDGSSNGVS